MGWQQYHDTVRYKPPPPPPRRPQSPWPLRIIIGCCGGCSLLLLLGSLWFANWVRSPAVEEFIEEMPRDKVYVGEALDWRETADELTAFRWEFSATTGNFDADPDTELLFYDADGTVRLYDAGGHLSSAGWKCQSGSGLLLNWDSDGDTVDELVLDIGGDAPRVEVREASGGRLLAQYDNRRLESPAAAGDYDGDGRDELLLRAGDEYTGWLYSPGGGMPLRATDPYREFFPVALAVVDASGRASVVSAGAGSYWVYPSVGRERHEYWNRLATEARGCWALDLEGDGIDELINPGFAILDVQTGKRRRLIHGRETTAEQGNFVGGASCALFHPPEGGPLLAVVSPDIQSFRFFMFDIEGRLVYEESRWDTPVWTGVLRQGTEDCLVLLTEENILVYP